MDRFWLLAIAGIFTVAKFSFFAFLGARFCFFERAFLEVSFRLLITTRIYFVGGRTCFPTFAGDLHFYTIVRSTAFQVKRKDGFTRLTFYTSVRIRLASNIILAEFVGCNFNTVGITVKCDGKLILRAVGCAEIRFIPSNSHFKRV